MGTLEGSLHFPALDIVLVSGPSADCATTPQPDAPNPGGAHES